MERRKTLGSKFFLPVLLISGLLISILSPLPNASAAPKRTVTYDANGATGGTVPVDASSPYTDGSTVTVLGNTGSLVKTNYSFANWNTAANGSGTSYSAGNTFTIGANTVLYAQWTPITYTVTYNGNGSTGGTAPVDGSSPYLSGSTVTVLGNTGSLVKTNYSFANWNTAANGSGTSYAPSATFTIAANTVLYAQWTPITYTVTYNGNGSTGGTVPVDGSSPYLSGSTVTVFGNTGALTKVGYIFGNWNTAANGSGTSYSVGNTFAIAANTVLYAQWTVTYSVTYNGNGNTGGTVPVDGSSPYASGTTVTVFGNTGSLVRTGNTFANWNTAANGSGTSYAPSATFSIAANTILYAQWRATVTYDGNGATGGTVPVDSSSPYLNGATVTVFGNTGSLTKTGYSFAGWNTAANGSGTSYSTGNTFAIAANTILYAQWSAITYTVTYNGNGQTSGSAPIDGSSPYASGATVTVLGNIGPLVKLGYGFSHWNTVANGSGTSYSAGNTFTIGSNTVLYAQWVATYTVTYNGNGKTGGSSPTVDPVVYDAGATVTVLGNTGSLVRTGNTFSDWNTAADGGGTQYAANDTFIINSNIILYAQWRAAITYDGNGNAGGTVPVDGLSPYLNGAIVTVLGNIGSLVKSGYNFANWNTAANGSGTSYSTGNAFAIAANTVLYAQWTIAYHVTYNGNGSTSGTVPVDSSSPYPNDATVTVLANTGSLARTGNTFANWNTAADGSGTSYAPSATFAISTDTTLYAQWRATVIYNGNGSTGGTVPVDGSSPYLNGATVTVLGNIGSLVKADGDGDSFYTFSHWNTAANGLGTSYSAGNTFSIAADTVLYAQWIAITYTVTYNGNGSSGGTVPVDSSSPYLNGSNVTVLGNTGSLVKSSYVFAGWNTVANGSGTAYAPSDTFHISIDTVLYAQWTPLGSYTISYNGNGNTGGTVPVDASSPYISGTTVTVLGNIGSLVRTGNTFTNWNTVANGSGTSYSAGNTFAIGADIILYAQWTATVTYDGNGSTGGTAPVDGSSPYRNGATITVLGNTGSLVKSGYSFANWNTVANGSGTSYSAGNTFTIPANTVLYAQWSLITTYTVTYNGNGNTGGSVPIDGSSPYASGATVTVLGNTGSLVRTGNTFSNWNTAANGSGTSYAPSATFTIGANTILYAQWRASVAYNGNGNTGGTAPIDGSSPYLNGATVTVLGNTGGLVRTGYTFAQWNTAADDSGTDYAPGDTFAIAANTVLYAEWAPIGSYTVGYNGNGSTGGTAPVDTSSPYVSGAPVTVLGNTGSLVKGEDGHFYTFVGWNTAGDGLGTSYSAGDIFVIGANTVLYAQWKATLTYDANGATGGTVPVDPSSPYPDDATVTVLGNTGSLAKSGYVFANWNTAADGSGTSYAPSSTFIITSDEVLYAHWTPLFTLVYNGNGNTGGTVPVDGSSPYVSGATVTVLGNLGSLVKSSYTFVNWNTASNGTGTSYSAGNTFSIASNTTLYAQWSSATYTVTYDGNGSTSGTVPVDSLSPYTNGASVTVLTNSGSLGKIGYVFAQWNTVANGSGTSYAPSATFTIAANTTLYAQWTAVYTVIYRPAGSTGGVVPVDGSSPYVNGATVTVLGNSGSLVRTGTTFDNWNTAVDGSGSSYSVGNTFTIGANTLLFAQWRSTLTYNANGATGGTAPIDGSSPYLTPYINSPTVTVLGNSGSLVKQDEGGVDYYPFAGWNTAADGSGTTYLPGDEFVLWAHTILYAQWAPITYTIAYNGNGSTSGTAPVDTHSPYDDDATVTVLGNSGSLSRIGYIFAGWNTAANGTGTSYLAGNTFLAEENTVLYARWVTSYTVTYDGNGNTGGVVPIDNSGPYASNATVTVLGNTGSLVRAGNTFGNWNTAADGSGTTYAPSATFAIGASTILYAQWRATVTYVDDGSTGGTLPVDASSPYLNGAVVTVLGNPGSLVRTGYTFVHWGTGVNNSGEHLATGDQFVISANTVLYPHWAPVGSYTLAYNGNGATGGTVPVDASSPYLSGASVTVLGNTGSLVKAGSIFTGWKTSANGSGTSYAPSATFTINSSTILYAQWAPGAFTIAYHGNGSTSGSVPIDAASPYANGATVTVLGNTGSLARNGYTFANWNTAADGSGSSYAPSATFAIGSNTILYAQWTSTTPPITTPPATGTLPPVASAENPVTQVVRADAIGETTVAATIEGSSGIKLTVSVTVPAGAISTGISISIAPAITNTEAAAGSMTIKITATDSSGAPVTHFDKPLVLNLGSVGAKGSPMFSEDGIEWTPIQKLSGTTLPEGVQEGYYIASDGAIVILTRHLTYFGMKKYQEALGIASRSMTLDAGKYTRVIASGGSGKGVRGFSSLTPALCSITKNGLLKAKSAGICTIQATRSGDGTYLATSSSPLNVAVSKIAQRPLRLVPHTVSLKVGESSTLTTYGGSGTGLKKFTTSTPTICAVSDDGTIKGISPGNCIVTVTKDGDGMYLDYSSPPISFTVQK